MPGPCPAMRDQGSSGRQGVLIADPLRRGSPKPTSSKSDQFSAVSPLITGKIRLRKKPISLLFLLLFLLVLFAP